MIGRRIRTLLVCGGRDYQDFPRLYEVLCLTQEVTGFSVLVHGGARGADSLAGRWAGGRVVETRVHPADWNRHGRAAGPIRNQEMLDQEHPDAVVAFPGGSGTADMVRRTVARGLYVLWGGLRWP